MKRMLRMLTLLAAYGCGGGGEADGGPPSAEPGHAAAADSAQKDNTGPAGARTGG